VKLSEASLGYAELRSETSHMAGIGNTDAFRHDWQWQIQPEICSPLT
jgi:hypothetical protein